MEHLTPAQQKTLTKIVRLARENTLSASCIKDALEATGPHTGKPLSSNFLTSILGYLGGALVLSGLLIYTSMIWEDISSAPRILLSLGSGVLAFVIGTALQKDDQTHKASLPLWIVSGLFIPTGLFVFLHEYTKGDDLILGGVLVFGLCTLLYLFGFMQYKKSALLFFTLCFGVAFTGTLYEHIGINVPAMWFISGLSMLLIGLHIHRTRHAEISGLSLVLSWFMLTASTYYHLGNTELEGIISAFMLAAIFMAYHINSRSLLIVSALGFIAEYGKNYGFCWGYLEDNILKLTAAAMGASMMFFAQWIKDNTQSRLEPLWNFFGANLLFSAFMGLLYESPYDILFPAIPAFVLFLSLKLQSRTLLLCSILALLSFISYYSVEYFADVVGWPIALMISGMSLIGLCAFALKMSKGMKAGAVNA